MLETHICCDDIQKHLFKGTPKAFKRMPGYCGFMPESQKNPTALAQANGDHDRRDPKNCRLFTLHQFLLEIPGTAIFQPVDAANLMAEPKGRGGTATSFNNALVSNPETLADLQVRFLSVQMISVHIRKITGRMVVSTYVASHARRRACESVHNAHAVDGKCCKLSFRILRCMHCLDQ